jgi:acetone carboxylase gamma subunit
MRCSVCEQDLGGYGDDYKQATLVRELPLTAVNPGNALCRLDEFVAREFCCPGCGTAVALDIQRPGEPVQDESRFVASALGEAG